jgi:hypothetical protein
MKIKLVFYPDNQFLHAERLTDVIGSTGFKPFYQVAGFAPGCQENHRQLRELFPDLPAK